MSRRVQIREVGPRDGFQNEPERIPTDDKVRLINALGGAGFKRIEVASFVRPDVIPQLSDAVEVLERVDVPDDVALMVLIPNSKGLDNALKQRDRFHEAAIFVSASETHNKKNVNRSISETMADNAVMARRINAEGLRCAAVIATSFGCPYEGRIDKTRVLDLAERFAEAGAVEIGFGDTTGMANPAYASEFFAAALDRLPGVEVTAHFHNTRGQGLANAYAALEAGCDSFESSFGELGGCPVPPGSTGNIATEDLVSMFHEMGVETGLDLPKIIEAAREAQSTLGRKLTSHTIIAGPVDWKPRVTPDEVDTEEKQMSSRVALVTGGAQGIGQGIATVLGARGYAVAVADLNLDAAKATAEAIETAGGRAIAVQADVTDTASVQAAVKTVVAELGRVEVVVNNAGWDDFMPFLSTTEEFWDRILEINFKGALRVCQAVVPGMVERGFGRVVNIGSDAGRVGSSLEAVYSGAKGGIIAFSKTLAREVATKGVTVNVVCPGPTDTPALRKFADRSGQDAEKVISGMVRGVPMKRLGLPEDIASAVAFFTSDDAGYVTGQTLSVSGGLTMA